MIHPSLYNHRALLELPNCEDFDELVAERIEHDVSRALASQEPGDQLQALGAGDWWMIELPGDGQNIQQGDLSLQMLDLMRDVLATVGTHSEGVAGAVALRHLRLLHSMLIEWAQKDEGVQRAVLDRILEEYEGAAEAAALDRAGV